jgi:hypothetical protein
LTFKFPQKTLSFCARNIVVQQAASQALPAEGELSAPAEIMLPSFRFDPHGSALVSSQGIPLPLPHRLGRVIEAMLQKDPSNPKIRLWRLSYKDVSTFYKKGWLEDKFPKLTPTQRAERFELFKAEIEEAPAKYAHEFSRKFKPELDSHNIPKKLVFCCDKRNKCYRLGTGWNTKRPLLSKSASRIIQRGYRDFHKPSETGKKTPIRRPDTGQDKEEG